MDTFDLFEVEQDVRRAVRETVIEERFRLTDFDLRRAFAVALAPEAELNILALALRLFVETE